MLENVWTVFEQMNEYQSHLKKKTYIENMKRFRAKYGHYLDEMTTYVAESPEKQGAAEEVAILFLKQAFEHYKSGDKVKSYVAVDMRLHMIYYVIPALLLTEKEEAKMIADSFSGKWADVFADRSFRYSDYETIKNAFKSKIFGLF